MSDPLLEINNLHVHFETYDGRAEVINGIDLTLERGETAALVGESGCGKSVTVKTILGLLPEAKIPEGEILYKGENLLELSEADRHARRGKEISMIMQNPMSALNPVFTIGTQMTDLLKWQGKHRLGLIDWVKDKAGHTKNENYRKEAVEALERVEIAAPERIFDSYPVELSGGMRQRVLIAMALLSEPDLLIADEPGTALDVTTEAKVLQLLDDLVEETGATVLYITHDLGVAREVSSSANVMYAGEIVEEGPTETLFEDPQHPYTMGLLESIPKVASGMGKGIEGQLPSYTDPPRACRFADRCPFAEDDCREVYPYKRWSDENHAVACHLYDGPAVEARHEELAETTDVQLEGAQTAERTAYTTGEN